MFCMLFVSVNDVVARAKRECSWTFDKASLAYRHGGAGNNWALGYSMCSGEFLEASLNCIRRELEYCENPTSLVTLHSMGGGTGSGLGTRMTEAICDHFPDITLLNIAVAPYHFSEVVVQHYNSLLCLSKIAAAAHGVVLFENEIAQELCKSMRRIERPTLNDINQTLASNILPVILPKYQENSHIYAGLCRDLMHLCPHPNYKLLDVKHTPQTSDASINFTFDSWSALIKNIENMQAAGTPSETSAAKLRFSPNKGLSPTVHCVNMSSLLILRGLGSKEVSEECITSIRSSKSIRHASWSDCKEYYNVCTSPSYVNGYQRSLTLISNGQTVLPYLRRLITKATDMFKVGAYVHQYTEVNGDLEIDDFVDAFRALGQIHEDYKLLGRV